MHPVSWIRKDKIIFANLATSVSQSILYGPAILCHSHEIRSRLVIIDIFQVTVAVLGCDDVHFLAVLGHCQKPVFGSHVVLEFQEELTIFLQMGNFLSMSRLVLPLAYQQLA